MVTKQCKCRYDAAGHKILSHADMLKYYSGEENNLNLIKRFMPHRLICMPAVEILIDCRNPGHVDVYLIYPGETRQFEKDISERAVEGLRRTYAGKKGWRVKETNRGVVSLRREGRVIMDPLKRFGVRA